MKVILPMARIENAYKRSVDYNPMTEIAGKPLLGHLLQQVTALKPEEIIFIVSGYEQEIIDYVKTNTTLPFRFIKQKEAKGSAHAIYGAQHLVKGEVAILFSDSLFDTQSVKKTRKDCDGIIWVSEVSDPRPLGVVFTTGDYASRLIEKPDEPISTQAMIGFYVFNDAQKLFKAIKHLLDNNIKTKGEFHLTDAIQYLIDTGSKIAVQKTDRWVDVDSENGLMYALDFLCSQQQKTYGKVKNSVVRPPVYIGKGSVITNSVIGPNVSVGNNVSITNSLLENTVVESDAKIEQAFLVSSIIRKKARVSGHSHRVDVAEESHTTIN